jgi:hypothetical protein
MNLAGAIRPAIRTLESTISFDPLNVLLPSDLAPEEIEVLISALHAENILIVEAP